MTVSDYPDDDIRRLFQRVLADQQSVPAPTFMPKREIVETGSRRELSFDEIVKLLGDQHALPLQSLR